MHNLRKGFLICHGMLLGLIISSMKVQNSLEFQRQLNVMNPLSYWESKWFYHIRFHRL